MLAALGSALAATLAPARPALVASWLDQLDASARFALIRLVAARLRPALPAQQVRAALAAWSGVAMAQIDEAWHGVAPPYLPLFAWLEGRAPRPDPQGRPHFRSLMLAQPLADPAALAPADWRADWRAEWWWAGLRVQLVAGPGGRRLFSRDGEDISAQFPEIIAAMAFHAVLDGTLQLLHGQAQAQASASAAALHQRLARPRKPLRPPLRLEDRPTLNMG
jgi:DNA ligase-1